VQKEEKTIHPLLKLLVKEGYFFKKKKIVTSWKIMGLYPRNTTTKVGCNL